MHNMRIWGLRLLWLLSAILGVGFICLWPAFAWQRWNGMLALPAMSWCLAIFLTASCTGLLCSPPKWWGRIGLLGGSLGFTFALVEVVLRLFQVGITYPERTEDKKYFSIYSNFTNGWNYTRLPFQNSSEQHGKEFLYKIKANSQGFCDHEHPLIAGPDTTRILALGDSFTEGVGASEGKSWPKLLEQNLGTGYEVINAGVAGSDAVFMTKLLEQKLLAYKPNIVITLLNTSDLSEFVIRGGFERFKPNGKTEWKQAPKWEPAFALSYLFRFMLRTAFGINEKLITLAQLKSLDVEATNIMVQACDSIQKSCNAKGIHYLFVALPVRFEVEQNKWMFFNGIDSLLAKKYPGHYLDLLPHLHLASKKQNQALYWEYDAHCTDAGYAVIAQSLAERLLKNNIHQIKQ